MLRLTPEDFTKLQAKLKAAPRQPVGTATPKAKRTKYGNIAVMVDGQRFDSKAEAKRYLQLKAMQQAGEISGLETQITYELIPALDIGGRKERPVRYVADFRYIRDGLIIVEDTKSAPTKTKEYIIKRKLMLWLHKIVIKEVMVCD